MKFTVWIIKSQVLFLEVSFYRTLNFDLPSVSRTGETNECGYLKQMMTFFKQCNAAARAAASATAARAATTAAAAAIKQPFSAMINLGPSLLKI